MARDRTQGRKAQKAAATQAKVEAIRKEARAWYFRAILALLAAVPLVFLLSVLLGGVLAAVAGWCIVQGTKLAFEANAVLEAGGG